MTAAEQLHQAHDRLRAAFAAAEQTLDHDGPATPRDLIVCEDLGATVVEHHRG